MRWVALFLTLVLIPLAYSISIKELVSRYSFSASTQQMNVTNYTDFMVDKNGNGVNDTLVIELTTNNTAGTFIFVVNMFDKDGVLTNETNKTLSAGINKLNITFSSTLLSQNQFNYSIKIYNASRRQKYRKDNILTQNYSSYEEGFRVIGVKDSKINKTLQMNVTLNSPENKTHVTTLFISYNSSVIFSKESKQIKSPTSYLTFNFDNETIKRTHYIGNFTITSLKVGRKTIKTDFATSLYDFRDFAVTSYISNFTDNRADTGGDKKFDFLDINATIQILKDNNYTIILALYDLFDKLIEAKNNSYSLNVGKNIVSFRFNGSSIYEKKVNGPFLVKYAELYENGALIDKISNAHTTGNYNFNDFESPALPDISVNISVSSNYRFGIENITINFTFINIGKKHAFNVNVEFFDNGTFSRSNKSNIMDVNSKLVYQFNFTNISDFEVSAIADLQNLVEEANESNNADRIVIKLNKKPSLASINNITANETDKITVNLSASDPNGDNISYFLNLSKFSNKVNVFEWNTTTIDSGNYTAMATASDGFLNDTFIFRIVIFDVPDKDIDNDGIEDSIDKLIGNENSVNTSTINLSILIDNSRNLSKQFNGSMAVKFIDNNLTIVEFDFNFSRYRLNLSNVTVNKQATNATGSLLVRGLKMPEGTTKTLYLDRVNATNGICIKEEEILTLNEVSSNCNSNNEFKVECDGTLQNSYLCIYNSSFNRYKVEGLKHSGIVQIDYTKPASSTSSSSTASASSSGGGGGGFACISNWKCEEWTNCIDGVRKRKCSDINQCPFPSKKPIELEQCNEEIKLVNIIKPLESIGKSISQIKQKIQSQKFTSVTGQTVKFSSEKLNFGIFIIFIEVIIITGIYLAIRAIFLKNV